MRGLRPAGEAEGPARHGRSTLRAHAKNADRGALIGRYRACIEELLRTLSAANLAQAAEIARIPEEIRGFGGHVKARHLAAARGKWATLMAAQRASAPARQAATEASSRSGRP